jgi:hypothetical protein
MQDTVNQVHGAVPRALADIVGVIGVVLADREPRDFQHLGGACRAGGNERIVGRVQQSWPVFLASAAPCGVRRSPRCRSADATPRTAWAVLAPLWRRHARPCPDNPCQGIGRRMCGCSA